MTATLTDTVNAQLLEAGDEYLWRADGRYASRTVLGVLQHTPMGGVLLEVRDPWGTVFKSHVCGCVDRLVPEPFDVQADWEERA